MALNFSDFTIETTTEAYESLDKVTNCNKNPGHEQFYSLAELTVDILPAECRTEQCRANQFQWLSCIRNFSKRVVRLIVYKPNGVRLYGTGWVIKYYSDKFVIRTNHHVVGSQEDVSNCHIEFFYDTVDRTGVLTSNGVELLHCDTKHDICQFTFTVPEKIEQLLILSQSTNPPPNTNLENVIAISHPHGGPKTITIGKWLGGEDDDGVIIYIHSARTCGGSSGCPLLNTRYVENWSDWRDGYHYTHFAGKKSEDYEGQQSNTFNVNYSVWNYL